MDLISPMLRARSNAKKTVIRLHMGGRRCRQQVVTAICLFATRHLQNLSSAQADRLCYPSEHETNQASC